MKTGLLIGRSQGMDAPKGPAKPAPSVGVAHELALHRLCPDVVDQAGTTDSETRGVDAVSEQIATE